MSHTSNCWEPGLLNAKRKYCFDFIKDEEKEQHKKREYKIT